MVEVTMTRTNLKHLWRAHIRPVLVLLIILTSMRSAIADWNTVPTGSMKPSIVEGDRIFVNKLAYGLKVPYTTWHLLRWDNPDRGEIVVFFSPKDGIRLVKRIVGLPGDEVQMINEQLIINGTRASYQPLAGFANQIASSDDARHEYAAEIINGASHPVMATPSIRALRNYGPVTVPPGHYLVLGDNRDNSADSRFIGMIPASSIVGRSSFVVLSLDYDDYYLPRRDRWFKKLP
jgi:signal peptidase I